MLTSDMQGQLKRLKSKNISEKKKEENRQKIKKKQMEGD